jgi:hypothetical protein
MRTVLTMLLLGPVLASTLPAQQPGRQRQQLQQRVMQRYMQNFRSQAGLTDEQFQRFREVSQESFAAREGIRQQERALWMALEDQLRPGVAAAEDSVTRLLEGLLGVQAAQLERTRQEQARYAEFLTPVQRSQLMLMSRRLQQNIEGIIRRRGQQRVPGQPRPGTGGTE